MLSMICNCPIASLYSENKQTVVDEILYGMAVEILEEETDGWVKIRTQYRYEGFLHVSVLGELPEAWSKDSQIVVVAPFVDILDEARVKGKRLLNVPRGARLLISHKVIQDGWQEVNLLDGRQGYVPASALRRIPPRPMEIQEARFRRSLVESAEDYLQTPYRWGGKTPIGIDCSGFCSMVYLNHGVVIYRDAAWKEGFPVKKIPIHKKQPGDLLYFPGHIAMVIEGDLFIHATAKPDVMGVTINSLYRLDSNYREDLAGSLLAVGSIFA